MQCRNIAPDESIHLTRRAFFLSLKGLMTSTVEPYIGLLIQVPLVGMFIWFTLRQNKDFLEAMEKRDEQWRGFLNSHTESTNQAIGRIAEEVKSLSREVSALRSKD